MNEDTICAVVVTYNRKNLLIECIEALVNQSRPPNAIYIMDNASTDGTPELLFQNSYIDQIPQKEISESYETTSENNEIPIHYIRMHGNTGGAGGFHEGVKRAYQKDYDWIWLMDDDVEPEKDSLKKLEYYLDFPGISALCCNVKDTQGSIQFHHRGYFNFNGLPFQTPVPEELYKKKTVKIDMAAFLGILLKSSIIDKIGYPKKEFFIHADDLEYSIRLREYGLILLITNSIIIHKEYRKGFENKKTFFLMKSSRIPYDKLWLSYYLHRNISWIGKKYTNNYLKLYYDILKGFLIGVIAIVLFDDKKFKRINFLKESYLDGLRNNFDNEKPFRILYEKTKNNIIS